MDVQRVDGAVVIRFCDIQIDVSNCAAVFGEIERLVRAERPLLYVGGGVINAEASDELVAALRGLD